jgi:hypothetical protein
MIKDTQFILTEAMVHSATQFGVHIVKEIALATVQKQPNITLSQFIAILDNHSAQIKKKQTVTVKVEDPITPDVIKL